MEKLIFNDGFRFYRGDMLPHKTTDRWGGAKSCSFSFGATAVDFDDSEWEQVLIPHDFVLEGNYQTVNEKFQTGGIIPDMDDIANRLVAAGSLPGDVGWYRKKFNVSVEKSSRRVYLFFDGIYRNCDVYLNHFHLGSHISGYTGFYFDATDFINFGKENFLCIRVDATGQEGWWYEGGGIYRNVWLGFASPVHIAPEGTFIREESTIEDKFTNNSRKSAVINITVPVENKSLSSADCHLVIEVYDANGTSVGRVHVDFSIDAWSSKNMELSMEISEPILWSLEHPHQYTAVCTLMIDEKPQDELKTLFGIRRIRFDKENGFFLNEKPVKLHGVCCHQDHAGVGIAVDKDITLYRIKKLKEMGCNAYRCAHHPPSPELLDICDSLGMLVMNETRLFSSSESNLTDLRDLIIRDRNHPCVIIWSLGNEEIFVQQSEYGARIAITMRNEVRRLDPSRPVTLGIVLWDGQKVFHDINSIIPVADELDIMGFNYGPEYWDDYRKMAPDKPIVVSEASSTLRTRGCYETDDKLCRVYGMDPDSLGYRAGETQWKKVAETPWLSGIFIWTGIDYKGEPTPYSWPAVSSSFGVYDSCCFPKDHFFYYRSWWQDEPVLHIFPHWNMNGCEGEPVDIYCYSNCDEVELFLNGSSLGRKTMEKNWFLEWKGIPYTPGTLKAVGTHGYTTIEKEVKTTGAPYAVCIELANQEEDKTVAILNLGIVDTDGNLVPTADPLLRFWIDGGGFFLGSGSGNSISHESDKAMFRRAYHGLAQLLIKSDGSGTPVNVKVTSEGLHSAKVQIIFKQNRYLKSSDIIPL